MKSDDMMELVGWFVRRKGIPDWKQASPLDGTYRCEISGNACIRVTGSRAVELTVSIYAPITANLCQRGLFDSRGTPLRDASGGKYKTRVALRGNSSNNAVRTLLGLLLSFIFI